MKLVSPAIPSSNIMALGYQQNTMECQVKFKSGIVYSYAGVPLEVYFQVYNGSIYDAKQGRQSVGHSFFVLIKKGGYSYTKLGYIPEEVAISLISELPPFIQTAEEVIGGVAGAAGTIAGAAVATGTEILANALQNFQTPVEVPLPITAVPTTQENLENPPVGL